MSASEDLSEDEERAYELIKSEDGILQSELWKELGANSRKGSRLARSLAEKGVITREETVHEGRTTYQLQPVEDESQQSPEEDSAESAEEPAELSEAEQRAFDLIRSSGGLLQSQLWKELDASSRKGSRLARSLADKGLISREETVHDGRTTYRLVPTSEGRATASKDEDTTPDEAASEESPESEERSRELMEAGLELVRSRNGIHQSEFWKELDVNSRKGSRIASRLAEEGLIRREETTYEGQRTYFLRPAAKEIDFSLLMAGDEISPLIQADGDVDPVESNEFSQWVLQLAQEAYS